MAFKKARYMFLYNVEQSIRDSNKTFLDRACLLIRAWDRLFTFLKTTNVEDMESVLKEAIRFTHRFILHGDWSKLPCEVQESLHPYIKKCLPFAAKLSAQFIKNVDSLLAEIHEPWMQPALQAIFQDLPSYDDEIKKFFVDEGFQMILIRIKVLCEQHCKDLALRLTSKCLLFISSFGNKDKKYKFETLKDIHYSLLVYYNRIGDINDEIKQMSMSACVNLVRRWRSKRSLSQDNSRQVISNNNVYEVIATAVLSNVLTKKVDKVSKQRLLSELINDWLVLLNKNGQTVDQVIDNIRKVLLRVNSSIHLFMFCFALKEYDYRYRSICVELFIRGLSSNINEIERLKFNDDTDNALRSEIRLSNGFIQFADFMKDKIYICRECILTAFSLYPTLYTLNLLFDIAYLSRKSSRHIAMQYYNTKFSENEFIKTHRALLYNGKFKNGKCLNLQPLFAKFFMNSLLIDTPNPTVFQIFESSALDLAPQYCDDLATVLYGPRNVTLSWSLPWSVLKSKVTAYIRAHYVHNDFTNVFPRNMSLNYLDEENGSDDEVITVCSEEESEKIGLVKRYGHLINFKLEPKVLLKDLFDAEYKKYLKSINFNPQVVLTRTPINDIVSATKLPLSKLFPNKDDLPSDQYNVIGLAGTSRLSGLAGTSGSSGLAGLNNNSGSVLAQSVPGMDSLDMIIPESQEPTIQVVQISNCAPSAGPSSVTSDCQTVNVADNTYKNSPMFSQTCDTSFISSEPLLPKDSCSDTYVPTVSNSSQTSPNDSVNSSWSQVHKPSPESTADGKSDKSSYEKSNTFSSSSTGTNTSPHFREEGCSKVITRSMTSSSVDKKSVACDTADENKETPKKNEFESREMNVANVKSKSSTLIVKPKGNPGQSKEDPKLSSGSILRVIVRDCLKGGDQYIPMSDCLKGDHFIPVADCLKGDQFIPIETRKDNQTELKVANSSAVNSYSCPEQLFKLICKKEAKQESSPSASLPNFQHVFGRQGYQSQSDKSEENVSNVNCHIATSQDSQKDVKTTAISKASQTVPKDEVEVDKCSTSNSNVFGLPSSNPPSNIITHSESSSKNIVSENPSTSSSPNVILAYRIPVPKGGKIKSNTLNKSGSEIVSCTKTVKSYGSQTVSPKESVIRNNINYSISGALKNPNQVKNVASSTIATDTPGTASKAVQLDKNVGDETPCQSKPKANVGNKKSKKNAASSGVQRMMKSGQTNVVNNICQTEPPVVSIQVPLKTAVSVSLNSSDSAQQNNSGSLNLSDTGTSNGSVEPSVSSTTLEQLREFESVLEHITNTSQMKEKCSLTDRVEEHISSESLALENKSSFVTAMTVDSSTSTSVCTENKTTSISPPSSTLMNSPKISPSASVVLVSRPVVSPAMSVSSPSPVSPIPLNNSTSGCKINPKISKSKTKAVSKSTSPTSTLKVNNLPKPQQKPQEDEQTTQRIYAILDKYAEQLRNSPELKNKPAPRRRSNPPSNPSHSTKRKKSSHNKPKSNINMPSSNLDLSPTSEDIQTVGSEDSSNGVSQLSQTMNSPHNSEDVTSIGDFSSDIPDTAEKDNQTKHQIVITDALQNPTGRTVIVQENIQQSVINMDNSKLISGKQVVVGGSNSVPLALLPAGGNVKQVIFPVSPDGRPLVVATKGPKMFRVVAAGGVPSGSPILSSGSNAVLLRQMCLNKGGSSINLKQLKVPVMSSTNVSGFTPVIPTLAQAIPLTQTNFTETFGVSLDNAIMLNSPNSAVNLISNKRMTNVLSDSNHKSIGGSSNEGSVSISSVSTESKVESVIVSCQDPIVTKIPTSTEEESKNPLPGPSGIFKEQTIQKLSTSITPKSLADKIWNLTLSSPQKEELNTKDLSKEESSEEMKVDSIVEMNIEKHKDTADINRKYLEEDDLKGRKDTFTVICTNESVIKSGFYSDHASHNVKTGYSSHGEDLVSKGKTVEIDSCQRDEPDEGNMIFSPSPDNKKKCVGLESPIFNLSDLPVPPGNPQVRHFKVAVNSKSCEKDNVQKSLPEECEDLGVDQPSTSDLFPEAELMLEPDALSRDSTPVEVFPRSLDSSSSGPDSPSQSPFFDLKLNSSWLRKQAARRASRSKLNQTRSVLAYSIPVSESAQVGTIKSARKWEVRMTRNREITNDDDSSSSSFSAKLCEIVDSGSSWSDDNLPPFSEIDETLDSFAQARINAPPNVKPFANLTPDMITVSNAALTTDSSEGSLQECFSMEDCVPLPCQKNGVNQPNLSSEINFEVGPSGLDYARKRKSVSPLKYDNEFNKLRRTLMDPSEDSTNASDITLGGNSRNGPHLASAKNSPSKGIVKKGSSSFNNPSVPQSNKKTSTDFNTANSGKISFPSQPHSSGFVGTKRAASTKQNKNCKKR